MKVSSPIGDLPFEPRRLRWNGATLELEGEMGAWPARVEIGAGDLVALARVAVVPLSVAGAVAAVLLLRSRRRT